MNRYAELRHKMKTGDAILWTGSGIISWLIRLKSKRSHASLVVRLKKYQGLRDRVFLVEALAGGLELRLLSERVHGYRGSVSLVSTDLNGGQRRVCRNRALVKCAEGIKYDYGSLFRNILGRVSVNVRRFFCSEFVWWIWQEASYVEKNTKAPVPGDLEEYGTIFDIK